MADPAWATTSQTLLASAASAPEGRSAFHQYAPFELRATAAERAAFTSHAPMFGFLPESSAPGRYPGSAAPGIPAVWGGRTLVELHSYAVELQPAERHVFVVEGANFDVEPVAVVGYTVQGLPSEWNFTSFSFDGVASNGSRLLKGPVSLPSNWSTPLWFGALWTWGVKAEM